MILPIIALGLALQPPQSVPPKSNFEVEVVILGFGDASDSRRIASALTAHGRIRARASDISTADLERCMGPDPEPTEARRSCIRDGLPAGPRNIPIVVIALAETRERGSWHRTECIGVNRTGFRRTLYIRDFDHPRRDVSGSILSSLSGCILEARDQL